MNTGITQQITEIHQRARELVEKAYQGYRVFSIRNCSTTFYAETTTSIVEMHVDAVKCGKALYCLVVVNGSIMSISSAKEDNGCQWG